MKRLKFEIDPEDKITGVKVISLVDEPAMETDFIAFSKEKPQYVELKIEGYKRVVAGLALIPEKDFLRVAPDGEKYLAYFTKESVEQIRNKFHKQLLTNRVNVDHSQIDFIDAYMIESFIIDSPERLADVTAKGIKNAVMGSWFVAYKIEDEPTFQKVIEGELRGFSVEIFVQALFKKDESLSDQILKLTEQISELKKSLVEKIQERSDVIVGKDKGIFERKLKMIKSEIENY